MELVNSSFNDFESIVAGGDAISSIARKLFPINIFVFKYRNERPSLVNTTDRQLFSEHHV